LRRIATFLLCGAPLFLLVLPVSGCGAPAPPPPPKKATPAPIDDSVFAATDIQVTRDEFDRVLNGMSPLEVADLFGADPNETSNRYDKGVPGYTSPSLTIIHRWDNPDGSWATVSFISERVDAKEQKDLRPAAEYRGTRYTLPEDRKRERM